ncbi:hypothetical protein M3Y96_01182800 [Aphelenchoides besseyi]|nr:hypothetical protein M3Y96_01182800 [Aphelenchoides besseyi]
MMFVEGWTLLLCFWNLTSFVFLVATPVLSLQLQCTHKKRMDSRISHRNDNRKSAFRSARNFTGTTRTASVEIEEEPQVNIPKAAPAQKPESYKSTKKTLCSSTEKTENLKMGFLNSKLHTSSSNKSEKTTTAEEEEVNIGIQLNASTDSEDTDLRTPNWMQSAPMPIFKNGVFVAFEQPTNKETIKSKESNNS